jgi:uncharacterized protein YpmB
VSLLVTGLSIGTAKAFDNTTHVQGTSGGLYYFASGSGPVCSLKAYDGTALAASSDQDTGGSDATDLVSVTLPVGAQVKMRIADDDDVARVTGTGIFLEDSSSALVTENGRLFSAANDNDAFFVKASTVGTGYLKTYASSTTTTALSTITFTVVEACGNTTWSAVNSAFEWNTSAQTVANTANVDSVFTYVNGDEAFLSISGKDSYGNYLPAGTWGATATGGCVIDIDGTTAAAGLVSNDVITLTDGDGVFAALKQNTANVDKPTTCSVTITYGSATVITSSITFLGDVVKVEASSPYIAKTGGTSYRVFTTNAYDSAGNRVEATLYAVTGSLNTFVTGITLTNATSTTASTTTGNGITCGSVAGSAEVQIYALNADGDPVYSNKWTASCASSAYTYTASLDKASYKPGDIATLTITAKDSKGNLVFGPGADAAGDTAADSARSSLLGATTLHAIAGGQMTAVTAVNAADAFVNGVKTYQFTVGTTEGSYAMSVNIPDIATDAAKTVSYKVDDGVTTVDNAEVLAAIVKLIASINKQIRNLQKLIRR